jgi:hypothetical protein
VNQAFFSLSFLLSLSVLISNLMLRGNMGLGLMLLSVLSGFSNLEAFSGLSGVGNNGN